MKIEWNKAENQPPNDGTYWAIPKWAVDPNRYDTFEALYYAPLFYAETRFKSGNWVIDGPYREVKIDVAYWAYKPEQIFTIGDLLAEVGEDITGGII